MSSLPTLHQKIKTIVSPFHELLCSLHVFYQPEHHPKRLQWALSLQQVMPSTLQENINSLGELSDGWLAFLDLTDRIGAPVSCQQGISMLHNLPDAELVYLLMNQRISLSTAVEWLGGSVSISSLSDISSSVRAMLENLSDVRKLLITTLTCFEEEYFRQEWDYIMPWLNTSAAHFQESATRSPENAVLTLHPRLFAGNGTVTAQKAHTYYFPYETLQQVFVFPSTFIFPHLLIGWHEDLLFLPLAVDIPDQAYNDGPPNDLLLQLKALSDDTRLRILKLLWKSPHCTKQLAPVLGISEAAVSKQLKLLTESGFTSSERKGNYLFYSVKKEALDSLIVLQRQFLEQ